VKNCSPELWAHGVVVSAAVSAAAPDIPNAYVTRRCTIFSGTGHSIKHFACLNHHAVNDVEKASATVGGRDEQEALLGVDDCDAATAERYGWINRTIPDAEFDSFVDNFARRITSFDMATLAEASV
jgi:hypothetical protein